MTNQLPSIHTSFVRLIINTDRAAKKSANSDLELNCMTLQSNFVITMLAMFANYRLGVYCGRIIISTRHVVAGALSI